MFRILAPIALALLVALPPPGPAAAQDARAAQSAPAWVRPPAKDGFSYPDCYCTNRGERVELGRTACLSIGSQSFTARCEMSLNNPTWRKTEDDCIASPSARLGQRDGAQPG
ncbi:MAG: hypothetical protein ACI9ZH_000783 [Paracoccaceae bacterium]|jgi:hypothetical protein